MQKQVTSTVFGATNLALELKKKRLFSWLKMLKSDHFGYKVFAE